MSVTKLASRYAKSLLDLSQEQGVTEEVLSDVNGFQQMLENRDFKLLIDSPIINASKKSKIFKALFDGKVNKLTYAFFNIVLNKGREAYLPYIANEFVNQYRDLRGITTVKITMASQLSDDSLDAIKKKILDSNISANSLEVTTEIDPSIIGGYIVE
ncbi:MAG TPA: ATP synthase F1 subunit delta, partial [Saprospiraceae bacterium]|nr:ATP synthase F1 subunit delta [Saprospiraceae bacterium]